MKVVQSNVSGTSFAISGVSTPFLLSSGQSMTFPVTFAPTAIATDSGEVSLVSEQWDASRNHKIGGTTTSNLALSGSGIAPSGQLTISPSSYNFGSVNTGSTAAVTGTLTATGYPVTISSAASNDSVFATSGLSYPVTLAAGKSVSFTTKFAPQAIGSVSGSISFASNAANASITLAVTGTGVAQAQMASNPAAFSFGSMQVGTSKTMSGILTYSGGSSVTISSATASGGFTLSGLTLPFTLTSGQSKSFTLSFKPSVTGAANGSFNVTSNASNPMLSIPLSGAGVSQGALSSNPASLAFGSVQVGSKSSLNETVTNTGTSSVTISQAGLTGAGLSIGGLTLPITLAGSQSATFSVNYAPTTASAMTGNLALTSNATNATLNVPVSGTGGASGQLSVSPTSLSFGSVVVGSNTSLNGSLTATGAPVTVSAANSSSSEFVISGLALPAKIAAGQSTSYSVKFAPNATGTATGSLTFTSNASNASLAESLSGTGAAATQHSVHLTWTASTNVVGYNIYRGTLSGGPYTMINSALDATTGYTDSTVTSGQTYYYVVTAVNSSSRESGYSNVIKAIIPTP